jgi:hypothetical protein
LGCEYDRAQLRGIHVFWYRAACPKGHLENLMALLGAITAKQAWLGFTAYLLSRHFTKAKSKALETNKPATLAERGTQLTCLTGRDKVGPLFAWEGQYHSTDEPQTSGGKGIGAGGASGTNQVFFADGAHFLAVGPGRRLRSIKENGEIIWPRPQDAAVLPNGITPTTHPSGSTFGTTIPEGGIANHGNFTIYWGDEPPTTTPPTPFWERLREFSGVQSDWPFCFGVYWRRKRLGGAGVWGILEYDIEVEPY